MDNDLKELPTSEELSEMLIKVVSLMDEALEYCQDENNPPEKVRHAAVNYLQCKLMAETIMNHVNYRPKYIIGG